MPWMTEPPDALHVKLQRRRFNDSKMGQADASIACLMFSLNRRLSMVTRATLVLNTYGMRRSAFSRGISGNLDMIRRTSCSTEVIGRVRRRKIIHLIILKRDVTRAKISVSHLVLPTPSVDGDLNGLIKSVSLDGEN